MNVVINANDQLLELIEQYYADEIINNSNIPYTKFVAKSKDVSIIAYQTNKVMFQGKQAENEAKVWQEHLMGQVSPKQESCNNQNNCYLSYVEDECIGSDEVGTGDYFGPVVVCACYINQEILSSISFIELKDSKKISDATIKQIAPKLIDCVPHYIYVLENEKYNDVIKKNNLNKIKALMHNHALARVISLVNKKPKVIVDQFCSPENYYNYLKDTKSIVDEICFETKAEDKYLVVAIASIIARYTFLTQMDHLSKELGIPLRKGASDLVDLQAVKLVERYGFDILEKIAKIHFSNTQKVINYLKQ